MDYYGASIGRLIEAFRSLPGIGTKSAQRLAFHIISMPEDDVKGIAKAMTEARHNVHFCKCCCTVTDGEICPICAGGESGKRNKRQIMVVENSRDLAAYEKTGRSAWGYLPNARDRTERHKTQRAYDETAGS